MATVVLGKRRPRREDRVDGKTTNFYVRRRMGGRRRSACGGSAGDVTGGARIRGCVEAVYGRSSSPIGCLRRADVKTITGESMLRTPSTVAGIMCC